MRKVVPKSGCLSMSARGGRSSSPSRNRPGRASLLLRHFSWFRTIQEAASSTARGLKISEGWKLMGPSLIQRCAPLIFGNAKTASSSTIITPYQTFSGFQSAAMGPSSTWVAMSMSTSPTPPPTSCRVRKAAPAGFTWNAFTADAE